MDALNATVAKMFEGCTVNQKCSIFQLLFFAAVCDESNSPKEVSILNSYLEILGLSQKQPLLYFEQNGKDVMENDIKSLPQSVKEFLVFAAYELCCADGPCNNKEILYFDYIFPKMGLSENEVVDIIQKGLALYNKFR